MKIGIITYHFARNYGAVLQCYALQRYATKAGYEVEVLDYVSRAQQRNNSLHHKRNSFMANAALNAALLPFELKRRRKERRYVDFLHQELSLSPRFSTYGALGSYVANHGFDVVISGSDQVFNPHIDDFDKAFLLPFNAPCRKASFAASLGGAKAEELRQYALLLEDFQAICVRESSAVPIVQEICGKTPLVANDPVFLLEKDEWEQIVADWAGNGEKAATPGDYVLGYYLKKEHSATYLSYMRQVAKQLGLPLKVVQVRLDASAFRPEMIIDAGPKEFLSLLSHASFVCTDSFHGTAFSLLFDVPFVSFEPSRASGDLRKRDLLARLGQEKRSVFLDELGTVEEIDVALQAGKPNCQQALNKLRSDQGHMFQAVVEGCPCK